MNIIGLGFDATKIPRVEQMLARWGERFLRRVFTEGEVAYAMRRRHPHVHLAGRFAAKEAAMKALGTGRSQGVLWRDVEVVRHSGPPRLRLHGGAARQFERLKAAGTLLSISHTDDLAFAQVLLLGPD
jgi:holo-[acyl-carrier protein] synthase